MTLLLSVLYNFKETLIKSGVQNAQSEFSSDCIKTTQAYYRMSRSFCAGWRKLCKQTVRQVVRRDLISGSLIINLYSCVLYDIILKIVCDLFIIITSEKNYFQTDRNHIFESYILLKGEKMARRYQLENNRKKS